MKSNSNLESEWNYRVPEYPNGSDSFAGIPNPTKHALENLGEEGIKEIDKKIKAMIAWKKTLYGEKSDRINFHHSQSFENEKGDVVQCFANGHPFMPSIAFPNVSVESPNYVISFSKSVAMGVNDIVVHGVVVGDNFIQSQKILKYKDIF